MANTIGSLMIILSKSIPEDFMFDEMRKHLEQIKQAILINDLVALKKSKEELEMMCMMFITKQNKTESTELIKQMDEFEKTRDFFNPNKQ